MLTCAKDPSAFAGNKMLHTWHDSCSSFRAFARNWLIGGQQTKAEHIRYFSSSSNMMQVLRVDSVRFMMNFSEVMTSYHKVEALLKLLQEAADPTVSVLHPLTVVKPCRLSHCVKLKDKRHHKLHWIYCIQSQEHSKLKLGKLSCLQGIFTRKYPSHKPSDQQTLDALWPFHVVY